MQQHTQGAKRKFLLLVILAFAFIFTTASFSTVAAGQEPLSIKVGAYENHPKIYMNADGRSSGFWPDLIEQIAEAENWEIEYVWGTWGEGLDRLKSEEIDILPDVAFTEMRSNLYAFSEAPVIMSWTRVYANKKNAEIQSILDLKNKKIAALKSSVNLEGIGGLREKALEFNLNCTLLELDDYTQVFKAVQENRADAGITNRNFGNKNANKFNLRKTPVLFQPISIKFAFPKDAKSTPYLAERVNYHIKQLKQDEDSIYYRLLGKYFEAEIAEKKVEVFPGWLGAVLKTIAVLFVFFVLVVIISRIQVKRKTNEIRIKSEALRISEQKCREIYNSPSDAIFMCDASTGEILDVNRAMLEIYGYDREEALQLKIGDISSGKHPYTQDHAEKLVDKAIVDGPRMFEWQTKKKNGEFFWVEVALKYTEIQDIGYVIAVVRNITERKQVEEALKESEERYRSLINVIQAAVVIHDADTQIIASNSKAQELLGLTEDQMLEKTAMDPDWKFLRSDGERLSLEEYPVNRVVATRQPLKDLITGVYFPNKDNVVWLLLNADPVLDDEGKIQQVTVTFMDITEYKNAEEKLFEDERRLRAILDASPIGVGLVIDRKMNWANAAMYRMVGYEEGSLQGERARILYLDQEEYERVGRELYAYVDTPETGEVETVWVRKDGTHFDGILRMNSLDPVNPSKGQIVTVTDVSELHLAHKELRKSEERYRTLVETIGDCVFSLDMEGMFTFLNPAFDEITGYTSRNMIGRPFTEFLAPECIESTFEKFRQGLSGKEISIYEVYVMGNEGKRIPVELKVTSLLDARGKAVGRTGIARDISERKHLEAQFQQAQKMEAVGTLAGGIAHDFNNLLTAIQGNASLMLLQIDPGNPEYEKLKKIEQCVKSGADLTKQLLGFARGGAYNVKPINLNDIVQKTSDMFIRTKKEIVIHAKYSDELRAAEVDPGQMEQVLMNLYVNAWQAMPAGGELYLETENVALDEDYVRPYEIDPGKYVKVSVTDTGVGMDEATRLRIFEPFFTTREMGRGTGLGLASAYGIIRHHRGIINVYSEKGHGTTFNIYLPASESGIRDQGAVVIEEGIRQGEGTILLVDDEEMIIDVATRLLQELGYKILTAGSGEEAIEIYRENMDAIDLVILDMIMPGLGGGETYDMLRDINSDVRVILSSGYSINGQAAKILERGCNSFIQKPFSMKALSMKVREVMDDSVD